MARNKRSDLTEQQILGLLSEKWKKAESVAEIQKRAKKGYDKVSSLKCSLNDIWNIFKAYPECFLFREYVAEIQKNYIDFHTYKFGKHAVQEFNMQSAVSKMISAIKSIYGDIEKQLEEQKQKDKLMSTQIIKKVLEDDERPLGITLFDDDEDEIVEDQETKRKDVKKMNKKGDYKLLLKDLKVKFKNDKTPIEEFIPANGEKIHSYLIKKKVSTLGDFMNLMLDQNSYARFSRIGSWFKDQYNGFYKNVLNYINKKVAQENGIVVEENTQNVKESSEFFDNLTKIPSENFVKDSEKMDTISKQVGDYLKDLTDYYFNQGMSTEEIDKIMESEIENFHSIVDKKREENSKKAAASKIKAKIDDGVKYKNNPSIRKEERSHNPFAEEREF